MTYLDRLAHWLEDHRSQLEQLGTVTYVRSPQNLPNPSANLVISVGDAEVELLLWTTGEGEFHHGTLDEPVLEHVQVESPDDLQALLRRFIAAAHGGGS
jgi:hypothetical protein